MVLLSHAMSLFAAILTANSDTLRDAHKMREARILALAALGIFVHPHENFYVSLRSALTERPPDVQRSRGTVDM